jgi:hypothetical protein
VRYGRSLPAAVAVSAIIAAVCARSVNPAIRAQGTPIHPPPIVSITVNDAADQPTDKPVLAPAKFTTCAASRAVVPLGRCVINQYAHLAEISDEMQTIFPPGELGTNAGYLFWVAAHANNTANGALVLTGGAGPNAEGYWTLHFARKDGYGIYSSGPGPVLLPVANLNCLNIPTVPPPGQNPLATYQDQTFDLNYAAPGTVVVDPTTPKRLFMVYEGGNTCVGYAASVNPSQNAYLTLAVATSLDYGHSWPVYTSQPPLPGSLQTWPGPNLPTGAFGSNVWEGNKRQITPPSDYGRYAVLTPMLSLSTEILGGIPIGTDTGEGEPSAFLDDVQPGATPLLYIVHGYKAGPPRLGLPRIPGRETDLMLARAPLLGSGNLNFGKWYAPAGSAGDFTTEAGTDLQTGIGGLETPILSNGAYENCGDVHQVRHMGAINYVEETKQYLLTFVCDSPSDPATTTLSYGLTCNPPDSANPACGPGHSWFFATSYDPGDPSQWSAPQPIPGQPPQPQPQQISGSWGKQDPGLKCDGFKGWYPTFMSLGRNSGHLALKGFVFYTWGCTGGGEDRIYSSRAFTITTTDMTPPVTTASITGPKGDHGWYVGPVVVNLNATDDQSGVAKTQFSLDGGTTWTDGTSVPFSAEGVYSLLFRSIDVDDNVEMPQQLIVKIDATPPTTTITSTSVVSPVGITFVDITLNAQDNLSGVETTEFSLDSGLNWTAGTSLRLGTGTHRLLFRSIDVAGNVERTQARTFVVSGPGG